jgi:hypothetical protein
VRTIGANAVVCLAALALAPPSSAHVVYQRQTLRQWAQQASVIVVAEIRSPLQVWSADDGSDHQEFFAVSVVEALAGETSGSALDVFPHAEGVPRYEVGDTVLLFLDRTAERAEFAHLAVRFPYFTTQGAGHEWKLDGDDRTVASIALAWRAAARGNSYSARRALLLRQLDTAHSRLRAEAVAELTQLRTSAEFRSDADTHARLATMAKSDRLSVNERIGLIRILDGVPGFSPGAALLHLAAEEGLEATQRIAVIRAGGVVRDDRVTSWLRSQLRSGDAPTQIAALLSLGDLRCAESVPDIALLATADATDLRVVHAAIRALGTIEGDPAVAALEALAASSRSSVGSLARAQLRGLDRRRPQHRTR